MENITRIQVYTRENLIAPEIVQGQQVKITNRNVPPGPQISVSSLEFQSIQSHVNIGGFFAEAERQAGKSFLVPDFETFARQWIENPNDWVAYEKEVHEGLKHVVVYRILFVPVMNAYFDELLTRVQNTPPLSPGVQNLEPLLDRLDAIRAVRAPGLGFRFDDFFRFGSLSPEQLEIQENTIKASIEAIRASDQIAFTEKLNQLETQRRAKLASLNEKALSDTRSALSTFGQVSTLDLFHILTADVLSPDPQWKIFALEYVLSEVEQEDEEEQGEIIELDETDPDFQEELKESQDQLKGMFQKRAQLIFVRKTLQAYQEDYPTGRQKELLEFQRYVAKLACWDQNHKTLPESAQEVKSWFTQILGSDDFCILK